MSISLRTAYLTFSALLLVGTVACGGDDDGDDDGGTIDAGDDGGDNPDAAVDEADAAPDDPDAAVGLEGPQVLLGLDITTMIAEGTVRAITTIAIEGATASLLIQPVTDPECVDKGEEPGLAVGTPALVTDVAIGKDGTFSFELNDATIPAASHAFLDCMGDITIASTIEGVASPDGTVCGTVEITAPVAGTGTFGSVSIEEGTDGKDLPEAVFACDEK
ncbi:MAG TPA: hypothetical protein VNO33_09855 [Kofleriaceae bacterium]|nr:hypothetical protein [Kofleriaceae bacterium]